ncbi:Hypothetical predicted protein [Paramuricea clavata]|uniref:Uncharacterized protein n=1 Tax=Paramuricea clavata TaxID=317549 RepID=A0A7D9E9A2_PARCT|nr:Hypothetical predicted protein [Paramuricea clavata]CAB4039711.1 Hypothetical predicted protein [Paramuricea clavata]
MALEKALISAGIDILSSTVGLVAGKVYDHLTNKLKDGDSANEKLRQIIVRDLNDIKSKLDCLSLKDLDSSYSFLKEGVELLNLAIDQWNEDQKASEGRTDEATRVMNDTASGILNAALSLPQEIRKLKISSDKRFVSAQDCFKASREAATHAFNNKSLSIKDRIMACKLRIAARILESGLEDPEAATTASLLSLKELHGLSAIQEMFAVFLKGGLKSMLKKTERFENIMSVLFINHALYDFASKYTSKSHYLFTWPGIELKDRTFHPILHAREIVTKTFSSEEFVQQLNRVVVDSRIKWATFAVNSRGEIIIQDDDKITVIYSTGESKDFMLPDPLDCSNVVEQSRMHVAVDSNDNVYAVRQLTACDKNGSDKKDFVLYAFDDNYNIKHVSVLDFPNARQLLCVDIAVDKNQNLIMLSLNNQVYICETTGKLKFQFKLDEGYICNSLSIFNNIDIMIISYDRSAVQIYSTEGNLKSTLKVPEGHQVVRVAFHHGTCKIIVLTYVGEQNSWFLLGYSETGELENSVFFRKRDPWQYSWEMNMKSHPSGPLAVAVYESITFI